MRPKTEQKDMVSFYVHVPFCIKKCVYCDFISFAGTGQQDIQLYVEALEREISCQKPASPQEAASIYFGGGTPCLLSPGQVERIVAAIFSAGFFPAKKIEITMEANPAAVSREKLSAFKGLGVNRLSVGAQSFSDEMLSVLGRSHKACETADTLRKARQAGFDNIGLDMIFALPGQDMRMWERDIEEAAELEPEHISIYNLQVEEGTPLWEKTRKNRTVLIFPSEQEEAEMYSFASLFLKNRGYSRYEISNFSMPGKASVHNKVYWTCGNYIGLGVAAHSHIDGTRYANTEDINKYMADPSKASGEKICGTPLSKRQEKIFLGLRMSEGVPSILFEGYEKEVENLLKDCLLEQIGNRYRLTEQGVLLANIVCSNFV